MASQNYLLALEGGGTRSQAALLTLDGQVLQVQEAGDVNTNFTTLEQARQAVTSAVQNVLRAAAVPGQQVRYFVSSLIGPRFGAETFGDLCPNAQYHYYGERDVVFARAGIYRPHGVALVAATGATAFAIRADDARQVTMGGWGALLGDEGSAYHLGLLGLRAAVKAYEGREAPTALVAALCEWFGLSEAQFQPEMIRLAYSKPLSRAEIAGLAALVTQLAQAGDLVCQRLAEQVVSDLTALLLHAARRLFTPEERFDVVVAGGMVNAGDLVLAPLREALSQEFPQAVLRVGRESPAAALGRLELDHLSSQEEA